MASQSNSELSPVPRGSAYSNGAPGYGSAGEHRSVREQIELLIDLLYRRKWTIMFVFVLVLSGFVGYIYTRQPVYRAGSLVMLDLNGNSRSQNSSSRDVAAGDDRLFATNSRSLSGEIFLLENSEAVAQRVAKRLVQLTEQEAVLGTSLSILQRADGEVAEDVDRIASRLSGFLSFQPAHSDINAIRVAATSPRAGEASLLANLYAEEYVQLTQEESRSYLVSKRKSLEAQERQRREELREVEKKIENYMINHGVAEEGGGSQVMTEISDLQSQREEAQLELQQRQSSLQSLKDRVAQFDRNVATGIEASGLERRIEGLQEKIAQIETQKEDIYLRYPELRSPDTTNENLRTANRQIEQLRNEVERLTQEYIAKVGASDSFSGTQGSLSSLATLKQRIYDEETAVSRLQARIEIIDQRLAQHRARLDSIPEQSLELRQLQRQKANAERMHQLVVERLQETRVAEESEPGYAHILQKASSSGQPERPEAQRYLILGCFLGLMGGIGLALVVDKLDNRIYKPEQALGEGGGLLGVIPSMQAFIREHHGGRDHAKYEDRQIETTLVSLLNPSSAVSEAYRQVRTKLRHGQKAGTKVKSLVISSAGTKDGKSVTAANLAVTLARSGQRTILVDGDLRRPRLHEIFDLDLAPGLVQLCVNGSQSRIVHEIVPNLHVMTAGSAIGNAAELLESEMMRRIFERLHREFDCIVVDTPPSLVVTDASILSTYCEGVLVVARSGQTKEKELEEVVATFEDIGSSLVGLLLNGFDVSSAYGHKYRYRQYSEYGSYFDGEQQIVKVGSVEDGERSYDI